MDGKSIISLFLIIGTICQSSWTIQIFPEQSHEENLSELGIERVKDNVNLVEGSSRRHPELKSARKNVDPSVNSREIVEEPPDHEIPFSEHENPKEVPTKPKYVAPGEWAKPSVEKDIPLDFVPTKLYAQVRGTHTVKHVPREEAVKDAETDEEKLNALRLREVVKNTKVNTVYTEEGYEDSAYDHAGHIRDADYHEGFARKLRNRLGEKHEEGKDNLEELADYEDDYSDENNEEDVRDNRLRSNIDPKSIVRNGIDVLASNVEKDAEEAEEASDIHLFDSKKLKESTGSKTKSDYETPEIESEDTRIVEKKDQRYETTTLYNPVQETISDPSSQSPTEFDHYDTQTPTTLAYGQILWDFLKTQKTEPVNREATTLSPYVYQPTPIATMTIPGPYILPIQQQTTTLSPIFPASQTYHTRGLDSDLLNAGLIASISQNNDQVWPLQTSPVNYIGRMDEDQTISLTPASILNFEEPWQPSVQSTLNHSILDNYEDIKQLGTTILPDEEAESDAKLSQINGNSNDYDGNPLLNPLSENMPEKKKKYRVLVRRKPENSIRVHKIPKTHVELNSKKLPKPLTQPDEFVDDQRAKYLKVLNYVTNQDRAKGSNNFAVLRAPVGSRSKEVRYFDFRPVDRPAGVDQSSVPIESETIMREPEIGKKLPWNRPISSLDHGFLSTSSLPIYNIDRFPLLDLSPPPLPLPPSRYRNNRYRPGTLSHNRNKQYRDIEPILKYAPVIVDLTRKSHERRKRSVEYVKGEINNGTTNRPTRKRDYDRTVGVTKDGRRNTRIAEESNARDFRESDSDYGKIEKNIQRSKRRIRKTHEELLEDSPRISGRVVDEEIEKRFNKNDENDDKKLENVEKVKIDVPDFDYVEELTNQEEEEHPITTEATVDVKKYPFYVNERIEDLSGLKYALDPKKVPRKTATGMEFYDSRDKYKNCEEVEANLEGVLPREEKPSNDRGPNEDGPRLRNLGDKLDCFKAKYFDENPFDNPLFIEKNVGDPNFPKELDPKKLSDRILVLPAASEESIFQKLSKKPEDRIIPPRRPNRNYNDQKIEIDKRPAEPYGSRTSTGHRRIPKRRPRKERVSSLLNFPTEPYQKQVYEDVMSHITGTNNPYYLPKPEIHVAAGTTALETPTGHLNEFINKTSTTNLGNQANVTKIDGLLPPKTSNDFSRQNNPGRKRIVWKHRRRTPRYYAPRTIARYHAIKIQKRSIESPKADDLIAEESETISVTLRPRRRKFTIASKNLTSSMEKSQTKDPEKEASSRIIYTIRDRIRHSKPKDESRNVGEFTTTPSTLDEDTRRKEPRYNKIRRKPIKIDSSTDPTMLSTIWSDESIANESTTPNAVSNKRLEYSTVSRDKSKQSLDEDSTRASNKYEVHEQVDDGIVTTAAPITSTSLEYARVKEYLKSDPPGYKTAFPEETTEFAMVEETRSKGSNDDSRETSKENEDEDSEETTERSDESKEDITEKRQEEDDHDDEEDEDSNDSSEDSKESKEEDRTFFHFSSRPYSPPENYEDEKYSDLGKRINKPSFYHPPFSMLGYDRPSRLSRLEGSSEEDEDEDEEDSAENKKNSRLALHPSWAGEMEGQRKSFGESKYYSRPFWSYEYPWERRERLAKGDEEKARGRGRRTGEKSYGRFGDFRSKDSDEDVSSSKRTSSRVYPWDLYDVPSRKNRKSRRERYFDVDGSASEQKPVKYSSKYNSSLLAPIKGFNNSNDFELGLDKIKKDRDRSEPKRSNESTTVRRISSGGLVPEAITLSPIKDDGRMGRLDERNSLEVTSVATTDQKKRKNVTRKETRSEETNSSTQSPVENTSKSKVTERTVDGSKRRRILKKYSHGNIDTVNKDNSTERSEQVKRRRGKIRSTTVAPGTSTTTVSSMKPFRRRPQTFFKSKDTVPTASTTTVEHRSRVSKESFVRTTYPDNENSTINSDHGQDKFGDSHHVTKDDTDRNRGNITNENIESISVMTKETPDHVYQTKKIDKDGVKEMFVSIMPNKAGNVSKLESDNTEFEKEEEEEEEKEEEEDPWKIPQEESEDLGGIPSRESKLVGNLSGQTLGQKDENPKLPNDEEDEEDDEDDDEEEEEEKKSKIKYIRHPERRLYYYIERRR